MFGCTSDSLQYHTDCNGVRHNYWWDLDFVGFPNEGPGTTNGSMSISYLQDFHPSNTVRDAVIKQITYGVQGGTIAGTVDFLYRAPYDDTEHNVHYATAYGANANYNCSAREKFILGACKSCSFEANEIV